MPKVTVLMSVYNSEKYLRDAVDSILNQTFKDFEFLIINDGSTDNSLKILQSYEDPRIRLVSRGNKGLVASLNEGIALAKGEFIARQDSDDMSIPERLQIEVDFLDQHQEIGMVGSNYTIMDSSVWEPVVTTNVFTMPGDLKLAQITCNQYGHGSVLMRTKLVRELGGYSDDVGYVEDYHLWTRMSQTANIANIEQPLYLYRRNEDGITQKNLDLQIKQTFAVRDRAFQYYLRNRRKYNLLYYHPSGTDYRHRKSVLYRDLAYLSRASDKPILGCMMIALAIMMKPKEKKNYRYLSYVIYKPRFDRWEYEFL